jgi:hypothetical protein
MKRFLSIILVLAFALLFISPNAALATFPPPDPVPGKVTTFFSLNVSYTKPAIGFEAPMYSTWYRINIQKYVNGWVEFHDTWYSDQDLGCLNASWCFFHGTDYDPQVLLKGGQYRVRVQAWGPGGFNEGSNQVWSDWQNLVSPFPPLVTEFYQPVVEAGVPTLSWKPGIEATWSHLWFGTHDPNRTPAWIAEVDEWYLNSDLGCPGFNDICTLNLGTAYPQGNYKYFVQTWGPSGYNVGSANSWSEGQNMTIEAY